MTRHLTDELSDYADRRMSGPALLAWDRHVVVCEHCRYAVASERRLLSSLRSGPPVVSAHLQSMLLSLAHSATSNLAPNGAPPDPAGNPGPTPAGRADLASVPPIPLAPASVLALRLPTVAPSAPALHRSLRRAAAVAGLAASAAVAAAWAVGVAAPAQQPSLAPSARLTYPTFGANSPGAVPAGDRLTAGVRLDSLTLPASRTSPSLRTTHDTARDTAHDTTERSDR